LKKWLIIGGIVFAVLLIGVIVLISVNDAWDTARDVSVVILAIFQMISTLLMIALVAILIYAVMALRTLATETLVPKVSQTLDQVRDSAATAKNTTTYVAEGVATPLIKISSVAAGVKAAAAALARRNPRPPYEP
jgi:hypothetical protein